MKRIAWTNALLALAVIFSLAAGLRARIRLGEVIQDVAPLRAENRRLETHKRALLKRLNEPGMSTPFLTADLAVGLESDGLVIQEPRDVVLYRVSTDCPHCPRNYDILNELADAGVPVIGLAVDTVVAVVEGHRSVWDVRFPILVNPRGAAVDVFPRYATPALVVISQGEVVFLEFGGLNSEGRDALRTMVKGFTTY